MDSGSKRKTRGRKKRINIPAATKTSDSSEATTTKTTSGTGAEQEKNDKTANDAATNEPETSGAAAATSAVSPRPSGASSPEPNCAICLGKLENKSFTDSCFHTFCFVCLVEWSKVKPECPLCKQAFVSIYYNVRSNDDYDQYVVQRPEDQNPLGHMRHLMEGVRFRYRTTVTDHRYAHIAERIDQEIQSRLLQRPSNRLPIPNWRRIRQPASSDFRRSVYLQRLQQNSQPMNTRRRVRDTSPTFFRENSAQTHRLVPWLNRELNALLQGHGEQVAFVLDLIVDLVKRYAIDSEEFYQHVYPFIGRHTRQFMREFMLFAKSPYHMAAYDRHISYEASQEHNHDSESDSDHILPGAGLVDDDGNDSDVVVVLSPDSSPGSASRSNPAAAPARPDASLDPWERSIMTVGNPSYLGFPPIVRSYGHENLNQVPYYRLDQPPSASGWDSPTPGPSFDDIFSHGGGPLRPFPYNPLYCPAASRYPSSSAPITPLQASTDSPDRYLHDPLNLLPTSQPSTSMLPLHNQSEPIVCNESDTNSDTDMDEVEITNYEKPWTERSPIQLSSAVENSDSDIVCTGMSYATDPVKKEHKKKHKHKKKEHRNKDKSKKHDSSKKRKADDSSGSSKAKRRREHARSKSKSGQRDVRSRSMSFTPSPRSQNESRSRSPLRLGRSPGSRSRSRSPRLRMTLAPRPRSRSRSPLRSPLQMTMRTRSKSRSPIRFKISSKSQNKLRSRSPFKLKHKKYKHKKFGYSGHSSSGKEEGSRHSSHRSHSSTGSRPQYRDRSRSTSASLSDSDHGSESRHVTYTSHKHRDRGKHASIEILEYRKKSSKHKKGKKHKKDKRKTTSTSIIPTPDEVMRHDSDETQLESTVEQASDSSKAHKHKHASKSKKKKSKHKSHKHKDRRNVGGQSDKESAVGEKENPESTPEIIGCGTVKFSADMERIFKKIAEIRHQRTRQAQSFTSDTDSDSVRGSVTGESPCLSEGTEEGYNADSEKQTTKQESAPQCDEENQATKTISLDNNQSSVDIDNREELDKAEIDESDTSVFHTTGLEFVELPLDQTASVDLELASITKCLDNNLEAGIDNSSIIPRPFKKHPFGHKKSGKLASETVATVQRNDFGQSTTAFSAVQACSSANISKTVHEDNIQSHDISSCTDFETASLSKTASVPKVTVGDTICDNEETLGAKHYPPFVSKVGNGIRRYESPTSSAHIRTDLDFVNVETLSEGSDIDIVGEKMPDTFLAVASYGPSWNEIGTAVIASNSASSMGGNTALSDRDAPDEIDVTHISDTDSVVEFVGEEHHKITIGSDTSDTDSDSYIEVLHHESDNSIDVLGNSDDDIVLSAEDCVENSVVGRRRLTIISDSESTDLDYHCDTDDNKGVEGRHISSFNKVSVIVSDTDNTDLDYSLKETDDSQTRENVRLCQPKHYRALDHTSSNSMSDSSVSERNISSDQSTSLETGNETNSTCDKETRSSEVENERNTSNNKDTSSDIENEKKKSNNKDTSSEIENEKNTNSDKDTSSEIGYEKDSTCDKNASSEIGNGRNLSSDLDTSSEMVNEKNSTCENNTSSETVNERNSTCDKDLSSESVNETSSACVPATDAEDGQTKGPEQMETASSSEPLRLPGAASSLKTQSSSRTLGIPSSEQSPAALTTEDRYSANNELESAELNANTSVEKSNLRAETNTDSNSNDHRATSSNTNKNNTGAVTTAISSVDNSTTSLGLAWTSNPLFEARNSSYSFNRTTDHSVSSEPDYISSVFEPSSPLFQPSPENDQFLPVYNEFSPNGSETSEENFVPED